MMTSIMPIDISATSENERNTPIRLLVVRKYGENRLMSKPTSNNTDSTFSSRMRRHARKTSATRACCAGSFFDEIALTDVLLFRMASIL
ncbi:hypothetical protein AWB80_06171 [Caballeronia pedi]|uniref:Uncharacterized protein n=1 Tax=Caballeronia pedi TaxID=1777141 RepID=A0A158D1V7_9BURK|nr:hypothetical protein AWB80_06171 [Caballeronia pedi]